MYISPLFSVLIAFFFFFFNDTATTEIYTLSLHDALPISLCDVRYSAFQYALLSALALLPRYSLGYPAGWIADHGGWYVYYVMSFVLALPGLAMVYLTRRKIDALDRLRSEEGS